MRAAVERLDRTYYPESDAMGEHELQLQRFVIELLRPLIERWLREQGRVAHAGADQFFYWVQGDPTRCRAPDVYVVDGVAQNIPDVAVWKTWQGHTPTFALEIVGEKTLKDYELIPADYDAMGTQELIVFDPHATPRSKRRKRWQVYRRNAEGRLRRVVTSAKDRVSSRALGCWLRLETVRGNPRLRLATGWQGSTLVPTDAEAERAEKEAAEREVVALRAEIERLRRGG